MLQSGGIQRRLRAGWLPMNDGFPRIQSHSPVPTRELAPGLPSRPPRCGDAWPSAEDIEWLSTSHAPGPGWSALLGCAPPGAAAARLPDGRTLHILRNHASPVRLFPATAKRILMASVAAVKVIRRCPRPVSRRRDCAYRDHRVRCPPFCLRWRGGIQRGSLVRPWLSDERDARPRGLG